MTIKDLKDQQSGIYMVVRPYKVSPCRIDSETFNDVVIKVGRSKNLKKRLLDYLDFGFSEHEIVCLPVPEQQIALYERWMKNVIGKLKSGEKWRGHEWFFIDGYRHERCIDYTPQRKYDRALLNSMWSAMQSATHINHDDLIEFCLAFNLYLPGLLLGKHSILTLLWCSGNLQYEKIEKAYRDCITHSTMFGNKHLRGLLNYLEQTGQVSYSVNRDDDECYCWNSWTELQQFDSNTQNHSKVI